MELSAVQEQVAAWIGQFKAGYWPPLANLARLMEEVGELARELNHQFGPKAKKPSEAQGDVALELGDILFVVAVIANQLQISLDDAFTAVMAKYQGRDWNRWERKGPEDDGSGARRAEPGHTSADTTASVEEAPGV